MSDFLHAVTDAYRSLITRGVLSVESSDYNAQAFGNAFVVLAGENFRVRVVRDRDEIFADVASKLDPDNWFPLQRVIRAVGVASPPPEGLLTVTQAAEFVDHYFTALDSGLSAEQLNGTRTALDELGRFALKRLLDRVKGTQ